FIVGPVTHSFEADELRGGGVEAHFQALDLAGPAVDTGLGDAVAQVRGDLDQPMVGAWVEAEAGAGNAGGLMLHPVPYGRAEPPGSTLRLSKCSSNSVHSWAVTSRYSSAGRILRRLSRCA